ncbi:MAG: patatin family protein [Candidatus Sumerlaeia bacterium]
MGNMKLKKPLYLILGSGGARGLAHIGAIEALEAKGIIPDVILGCSMGAIVGAFFAAGWTGAEMRALAARHGGRELRRLVDPAFPTRSLIHGRKVARWLRRHLAVERIEDLPRRFMATAMDLQGGRLTVLDRGPLVPAIMASIAIPGVFPPLERDGEYFVDGGVVSPVPTRVAIERGAGSIIAVDVCPWIGREQSDAPDTHRPHKPASNDTDAGLPAALALVPLLNVPGGEGVRRALERMAGGARALSDRLLEQWRHWRLEQRMNTPPHIVQTLIRSMMIMQREMGDMHLRLYPPTVLIQPALRNMRAYEFDRMQECIELGRAAAEEALAGWEGGTDAPGPNGADNGEAPGRER